MKNILLVATGSVAMVKFKKIVNLLSKDYNVKIITTEFVKNNFDEYKELDVEVERTNLNTFPLHIEHAKWADLIIVAPATANTLAKFNAGIADNQVLSTLIAARNPIMFVPSMNTWMYDAFVERGIIFRLSKMGHMFIGPVVGMLREGGSGMGRMVEPEIILKYVKNYFNQKGQVILMPYGASKVYIDPIRFITNGSTGTMAKFLSNELRLKGHKVIAVDISKMSNEAFVDYALSIDFDTYISPAAFADFDVDFYENKIKKEEINSIYLKNNVDVITTIKKARPNKKFFAFKLDTDKQKAISKKEKLNLDGIIWNSLSSMGAKKVTGEIITNSENVEFKDVSKLELAKMIVEVI